MLLAHGLERVGLRRFDAGEDGEELRLAHQRQDFGLLGDIERGLAGKLQRIAVLLLPGDQMRQHLARGLAVADEIVVDEIDHRRMPGCPRIASSSAMICSGVFSRGCRP